MNKKAEEGNMGMIVMSLGIIFIVILSLFFIKISSSVTPIINTVFCSMSVGLRDTVNQYFLGSMLKNYLGDKIEAMLGTKNPISLLCFTNKKVIKKDAEKFISDEFLKCYEDMGKGRKTGIYPKSTYTCSEIYFDVSSNYDITDEQEVEENTVDLMEVYNLITKNPIFNKVDNFDKEGFDFNNNVRFCVNAFYQQNILRNLYDDSSRKTINLCESSYSSETLIGNCQSSAQELLTDEKNDLIAGFSSTCLSLREAAVNDWQFDLSIASKDNLPSIKPFCKKMCNIFTNDDLSLTSQDITKSESTASGVGMYAFANSVRMSKQDIKDNLGYGTLGALVAVGTTVAWVSMISTFAAPALVFGPAGWVVAAVAVGVVGGITVDSYVTCVNECEVFQYPNDEDKVDPDMFMFCSDLCKRECEQSTSEELEYDNCQIDCTFNCLAYCERDECKFNSKGKEYNFSYELTNLFGTTPDPLNSFSSSTKLGRGTFVIKYYDYSSWMEMVGINDFYVSTTTYSNIIYIDNDFSSENIVSGALNEATGDGEEKRDYFVIEYYPFIPFEIKHEVKTE